MKYINLSGWLFAGSILSLPLLNYGVCLPSKAPIYACASKPQISSKEDILKTSKEKPYKEHEVLVKFKQPFNKLNLVQEDDKRFLTLSVEGKSYTFEVVKIYKALSKDGKTVMLLRSKELTVPQMLKILKKDPRIEEVSPNWIYKPLNTAPVIPNDKFFKYQWGLKQNYTDAVEAWNLTKGSKDVVVAVVDTGIDYKSPDLKNNLWHNISECNGQPNIDDDKNGYVDDCIGYDFGENDNDPMDIESEPHGSHVSGIIGMEGNNTEGGSGVNWHISIMPLKVATSDGGLDSSAIIDALNYVITMKDKGVNIVAINASWGSYYPDPFIRDAIAELKKRGIIFVAAAANDAINNDMFSNYPSSFNLSNIIAVAASNSDERLTYFSNYGYGTVDVAAPGIDIFSTIKGELIPQCTTDKFFDDVETDSGKWKVVSGNWERTTEWAYSGNYSWSDSPNGNYPDNYDAILQLANSLNLQGVSQPCISFYGSIDLIKYQSSNINTVDTLKLEVSTDNGNNWNEVASFDSGVLGPIWGLFSVKLDNTYSVNNLAIRYREITDDKYTADGVHIDDIGIGQYTGQDIYAPRYALWAGTSMATPFVTGTVALIKSLYPDEDWRKVIARIVANVDQKEAFKTAVGSRGRLNIYKALTEKAGPFVDSVNQTINVKAGSEITINGVNFGNAPGEVVLVSLNPFNETKAQILSWNDTQIKVKIPYKEKLGRYLQVKDSNGKLSRAYMLSAWKKVADVPYALSFMASAYYKGKIYIFGGYNFFEDKASNDCYYYDISKNKWFICSAYNGNPFFWAKATVLNGKIYVIGGYDASKQADTDEVRVYDPETDSWSTVASLPEALEPLGVVTINNNLYVVGGYTSKYIYKYNPSTDEWETIGSLNALRDLGGVTAYNGKIYIFGGVEWNSQRGIDSIEICDASIGSCKYDNVKLPYPMEVIGATTDGDKIYILGNIQNRFFYPWATLERLVFVEYNPNANTNSSKVSIINGDIRELPQAAVGMAFHYVPKKNELIAIGGNNDIFTYNSTYALDLTKSWAADPSGQPNAVVNVSYKGECQEYGRGKSQCWKEVKLEDANNINLPENYQLYSSQMLVINAGGPEGFAIDVYIKLDKPLPSNVKPFKYVNGTVVPINNAYISSDRTEIKYEIIDNGDFDNNSTLGVIDDPFVLLETQNSASGGTNNNGTSENNAGSSGGSGGGGGCFIATAAYGSYLEPHVQVLREFRDKYLLTNPVGHWLVEMYYTYSPPIAHYIAKHEMAKLAVRTILTPIVYAIEYPKMALLVLIATSAGSIILIRRRRRS